MDSKKNKKKDNEHVREDLKTNTKNVNTNVLVLPPNLLQQLGIHLGNIKDTQSNSNTDLNTEIGNNLKTVNEQPNIQGSANCHKENNSENCEKQSSIIETANLMKESVLLSPTFNTLESNTVLCDEDANNTAPNSKVLTANSTESILETKQSVLPNVNYAPNQLDSFESVFNNNEIANSTVKTNLDVDSKHLNINHLDMADSIMHNVQYEDSTKLISHASLVLGEAKNNCIETKNKINIISEEVIDSETLDKLKLPNSPKRKILLPVTIDTIISTKKSHNASQILSCDAHVLINDHGITHMHNEKSQEKDNTHYKNINEISDVGIDSKLDVTKQYNKLSITALATEKNNSASNIDNKETSSIFSQISDANILKEHSTPNINCKLRKYSIDSNSNDIHSKHKNNLYPEHNMFSAIDNNFKRIPESLSDNFNSNGSVDKETTNYLSEHLDVENGTVHNTNNKVKLKACVQGVEKPGGVVEKESYLGVKQNIKTYLKGNKPKRVTNMFLGNNFHFDKDTEIDALSISYPEVQHCQEFCICWDFGFLDKNGLEENYEHIHFIRNSGDVQISPKILFSIYDENKVVGYVEDELYEETADTCNKICWDSIENFENSDVLTNASPDISQNVITAISHSNQCNVLDVTVNISTFQENNSKMSEDNLSQSTSKISFEDNKNGSSKTNFDLITAPELGSVNNEFSKKHENQEPLDLPEHEPGFDNNRCLKKLGNQELLDSPEPEPGSSNNECLKKRGNQEPQDFETVAKKRKRSCSDTVKPHKESKAANLLGFKRSTETISCGVCGKQVAESEWGNHISKVHSVMSWKEDDAVDLTSRKAVVSYLESIHKKDGELVCSNCAMKYNDVKTFLQHLENCDKTCTKYDVEMTESHSENTMSEPSIMSEISQSSIITQSTTEDVTDSPHNTDSIDVISQNESGDKETIQIYNAKCVQCGVCKVKVKKSQWVSHIAKTHNYLSWKHGEPEKDFTDITIVNQHLNEISKKVGGLLCSKCGLRRKYVKSYLDHVKKCEGDGTNTSLEVSPTIVKSKEEIQNYHCTCGVCKQQMESGQWLKHAQREHGYLAWKEGTVPLDVNNKDDVYKHLIKICNVNGELACNHCSTRTSNVTSYLTHVENCGNAEHKAAGKTQEGNEELRNGVKCAVCNQEVTESEWTNHIAREHNYLAWKDGEPKLTLEDSESIHQYLYSLTKKLGGLICNRCGRRRKYVKSYLHHIKTCEASEIFVDNYKDNENCTSDLNSTLEVSQLAELDFADDKDSTCGVCKQQVPRGQWWEHAQREHCYLAWREGTTPLDVTNKNDVREYLHAICKQSGELICNSCGTSYIYVKTYLRHILKCDISTDQPIMDLDVSEANTTETRSMKCGVCTKEMSSSEWLDHIIKEHNYLAWEFGTPKLKLDDEKEVYDHLYNISKKHKGLRCSKCGIRRKYVKAYLHHVSECSDNASESIEKPASGNLFEQEDDDTTCAVCHEHVEKGQWWEHAQREHGYLAWREGHEPLNLDDEEEINQYLSKIQKKFNALLCNKCGLSRKYVKSYLTHINTCDVAKSNFDSTLKDKDIYECAVCGEQGPAEDWKSHAMSKHYNIAWLAGDYPIDVKNLLAVEKYLKEYKQHYDNLECNTCGLERVSFAGFYAHIIQCGKKEEEIEMYKSLCDICNNKYLCIYKNQHMNMHREQAVARQRIAINSEAKNVKDEPEEPTVSSGRRRAAEIAKNVIQKYNSVLKDCAYKCPNCKFGADDEGDLEAHKCEGSSLDSLSDREISDSGESSSSDGDSQSSLCEAESDHLEEIIVDRKKKNHYEPNSSATKVAKIPFAIKNVQAFLEQSAKDFCKTHLTSDVLFPHWRSCKYKRIPDDELTSYMPLLEVSCKFAFLNDEWNTLKVFESQKENGFSFFVGASVQTIAWAPGCPGVSEDEGVATDEGAGAVAGMGGSWLAVASHRGADCPRLSTDCTYSSSAMLQIWEFGDFFRSKPKFVLGIAHNYGTVWAIDWCPSGTRDVLPKYPSNESCRLGLMAAACSNGSTYIFSVPYPSTIDNRHGVVYNLTPVAELRFSRGKRDIYQATSISWSPVKGHYIIVVGYSDGTAAFYNLKCESPLLRDMEGDTAIFYPYHDEKVHSTCVTDVNIFATKASLAAGVGVVSTAAPTGAMLAVHGAVLRAHLHTAHAAFSPHWPSVLLTGNDAIVNQAVNEIDCWGVGRRVGSVQCWSGCLHCGAAVAYSPPSLRVLKPHPIHSDLYGVDVATIQMESLESKKDKSLNTLTSSTPEPMSYEDVVKKYGIKLKIITKGKSNASMLNKTRELCPERFPLAEVPAMAFYPSSAYHRYLAVATHAAYTDEDITDFIWINAAALLYFSFEV